MGARQCQKRHWLSRYQPELATEFTEAERERMAQGTALSFAAQRLFPEGVLIEAESSLAAVARTEQALKEGATTLFEAAFLVDGLFARVDILTRRPGVRKTWKIIEVKSSLSVDHHKHIPDLAFQVQVVTAAGLAVREANVMTLNREFRLPLPIEDGEGVGGWGRGLFEEHEVWRWVRKELPKISEAVAMARMTESGVLPVIEVGRHCRSPYSCPFLDHCRSSLPPRHVTWLPRFSSKQEKLLRQLEVTTFDSLPDDFDLSEPQVRFIHAELTEQSTVDHRLSEALQQITYPAVFIDFEAVQPGIPMIPGTGPYERIPFQWSAHRLDSPDRDAQHFEFLAEARGDPRPAFAKTLHEVIAEGATILFYSDYEPQTIAALVRSGISEAEPVERLLVERGLDLLELVRDHVYLPGFRGKYGIKSVLPAMVPGFDYSDLAIPNGDLAQLVFTRLLRREHPDPLAAREALLRYCERDTEAMVRVYRALRALVA